MADYYLDLSAIGNEYQAYADTPTNWAVPQDGNGKAGPGHSAAVAVATIDVAGRAASGTGSIGVLGVTVSSTLNASGAALATAIAAAINASTTAVSSTYSANLLPLNRLVWARVNPGLNTQVQIMLRIAGTDWNGMAPTQANISPAATITAFSGGADGPFAYAATTSTVFGRTSLAYGCWFAAPASVTEPSASDVVHVRSRRAGVDLGFALSIANVSPTWRNRRFLYDNGTVWADGSSAGTFLFELTNTTASTQNVQFNTATGGAISHESRSQYNFEARVRNSASATANTRFLCPGSNGSSASFIRSKWVEVLGSLGSQNIVYNAANSSSRIDLTDSLAELDGNAFALVADVGATAISRIRLNGLRVALIAATGTIGTLIQASGASYSGSIEWIGGEVYDTNGVFRCPNPFNVSAALPNIEITCDGVVGVSDPAVGFTSTAQNAASKLIWSCMQGPTRGFRYEVPSFTVDWKGDGTFPHCGAKNLPGDDWSHRVTWGAISSADQALTALRLGYFYRAASAVKTITCELYVPNAATVYQDELELSISYMDSTDVWRTESSTASRSQQFSGTRAALTASAKSWTSNGVAAHSAKKMAITTAYAVKQNTEILIRLTLVSARSPAITFFVSPEVEVA